MRIAIVVVAALAAGGCGASTAFHPSAAGRARQAAATSRVSSSTPVVTTHTTETGSAAAAGSPRIIDGSFYSPAVRGTLHFQIALPPGYATSGKRYPVLYVLHGLPASAQAYKGVAGYAGRLAATDDPAIVVGAQGARPGDTDPEWHNWGPGRDWETSTQHDLVSYVDRHYRTIARRSGRGIIGISAGGYGAALIAIHHPGTYQVTESWSGYFVITDPTGKPLDLGSVEANADASAHANVPRLKREFARYGKTFFGFYIGTRDPYTNFISDNKRLDRELTAAGIPHVFTLYPGAHNGSFWRTHQDQWLDGAVDRLAPLA
jgi:enterochelin esterase-like enzyme